MRSPTKHTHKRPDATPPWTLWPLAICALLASAPLLLPSNADAGSQRCLHHRDCKKGFQCLQRRCFKGLVGTVGNRGLAAYKLAIPKVRWFGANSPLAKRIQRGVWLQVSNNFKSLPGSFDVLNPAGFLERPPYNGVDIGTFYFKPWQSIKTNGLIKVGLRKAGAKKFTLMFRFYDVDESKMIVRVNTTVTAKQYRWVVHQMCDKVYKYLTNKAGIFSTLIAYVKRSRKGGKDIWVSDFDGKNARRIISNGKINVLPRWSPDGRSLLFTSYLTGGAHLYKLNLATRQVRRVFQRPGTFTGGVISPSGRKIAVAMTPRNSNQSADIYIGNADGTNLKKLTTSWGIDVSPTWSPDGKRMAFVSERFASPQIFFMNADGTNQIRLTFKGNYNQEPRWSPKGNEILFTARDEFLQYDLFVIRLDKDTSGQLKPSYRRLTQNQGTNLEATWSPDGRYILFVSTRVGERKLYISNTDGTKQKLFIRGWGNYATPAWSPVMQRPSVPIERNYFAKVNYIGYKKDVIGNFVADPSNRGRANTPAKRPTAPAKRAATTVKKAAATVKKAATTVKKGMEPAKRAATTAKKAAVIPVKKAAAAAKKAIAPVAKRAPAKRPTLSRNVPVKRTKPTKARAPAKRTKEIKKPAKRSQPTKRREG